MSFLARRMLAIECGPVTLAELDRITDAVVNLHESLRGLSDRAAAHADPDVEWSEDLDVDLRELLVDSKRLQDRLIAAWRRAGGK